MLLDLYPAYTTVQRADGPPLVGRRARPARLFERPARRILGESRVVIAVDVDVVPLAAVHRSTTSLAVSTEGTPGHAGAASSTSAVALSTTGTGARRHTETSLARLRDDDELLLALLAI